MPRIRIDPLQPKAFVNGDWVAKLAAELKGGRDSGQPFIYEQEFPTGKLRVTVIWDAWANAPLEDRTAAIIKAYEAAEGADSRGRIGLASGLTVPEASAAGMLPFRILSGRRPSDPVTQEQVRQAMLDEGGSTLADPESVHLRFATKEEAKAALRRLAQRLPGSEPIWILSRELAAYDPLTSEDVA